MFRSRPPRFVVRTTVATLVMVAGVLTAVFIGFTLNVRERVRGAVADKLEIGQRMLSALEQRRARELSVQVATLAENPTLKAAVDTYQSELRTANAAFRRDMLLTIERELGKVAMRVDPDVITVTDLSGTVLAAAGRRATDWPMQARVAPRRGDASAAYVSLPFGVFQLASAPLALQDAEIGFLQVGRALDDRYAQELSALSGAATLILSGDRIAASTLPEPLGKAVTPAVLRSLASTSILELGRSEYAVKQLFREGDAAVYAFDSINASTRVPMQDALRAVTFIALGAFALAAIASVWLARTISRPIDTLSRSLSEMTTSRSFDSAVPVSGYTQEVDTLTQTFNTMMRSVSAAEADTRSAYVGAIRALATALDARDPYTSGHSERVSAVSVAIGRQMGLLADQLEILRLGALLHDIGKIGISDAVLRKPGALTPDEFELIQQHPSVGARILRNVHFLAPHLPIVELHHERPDGQGYPHRLQGDEIPLPARIVHVADAFDAMTSARAYRPARGAAEALRELWRCAGSQFDAEVVQALAAALPSIDVNIIGDGRTASSATPSRLAVVGTAGRATVMMLALAAAAVPVSAQSRLTDRATLEVVGGVNTSSTTPSDPFVVFDATGTVRVTHTLDVVVRPYFRRLPGGDWSKEMYQLQIRYQPSTPLPVRIDAGIISSPLGIIALEMRADRNPIIGTPSYYFSPLPSFDGRNDRVQLLSGGYPLGVMASVSGTRWDARAGVTDGTPARSRRMMSSSRPSASPQLVAGGGFSPLAGLRLGAGFAHGVYRDEVPGSTLAINREADATIFNLEGEYAIGYTRLAGEWIVDRFESAMTPAIARGFLMEAVQTLTPRWYLAARTTRVATPGMANGVRVRRSAGSADGTVGFRLNPDITLKAGYQGSRAYTRGDWDHAAAVSIVFGKRLF
jgi:putative nucleotidyltransferase with HDIG domain